VIRHKPSLFLYTSHKWQSDEGQSAVLNTRPHIQLNMRMKLVHQHKGKKQKNKIKTMIMKWKQYVIEVTIATSSIGENGYKGIQNITTYDISKK
jgi:hypothetical protein